MIDEHDVIDRSFLKTQSLLQPGGSESLNPSHELKTSNQSLDHLVEFKGSSLEQQVRSASPGPSHESMKSSPCRNCLLQPGGSDPSHELKTSNQSLDHLVEFQGSSSAQQGRPASPSPSHESMKSSQSINHPQDFKGSSLLQPGGSDPSQELKTSNQSLDHLVEFQASSSAQQGRPASPSPSHESMKSSQSINHPQDFKASSLLQPVGSDSPIHERKSSVENLEELRMITSIKSTNQFQCLHEGTSHSLVSLNDIYTELYITEGVCGEINTEHEVRQIEAAFRRAAREDDRPIECNDIFKHSPKHGKSVRSVMTKGVAGIGKTVSVQKFILDWAAGKANQDVHLIFPLPFRELNLMKDQNVSLKDVLHIFLPESKELDICSDKYKMLFILDGLDECRLSLDFHTSVRLCDVNESASVDVLLTNLIAGNLFPSALIWITSRPAAADLIPSESVDRVTEVRGFTDPQKEEYFRKRIKDVSLANKTIKHLKSSRSLYIMCHIPVFCWISATVLERMLSDAESEEIPKTLTQMYTHFLLISIRHEKDYERKTNNEDMILKLGKLAFQQLEKGNLIFYEEDLRQCDIDVQEASVFSGLCTQIFRKQSGLFQGKAYCFVHLSVQEHLAALYVYLTFINENVHVLVNPSGFPSILACAFASHNSLSALYQRAVSKALQSPNGHWDIFLRFFVGFSLESNQSLLRNLFTEPERLPCSKEIAQLIKTKIKENLSPEKSINLFHCLNELNDHYLVKEVQNYLKCGPVVNKTLSCSQWSALVFVLLTSGQSLDVFDLDNYVEKHIKANAAIQWLRPVIEASKTARLCEHSLTPKDCATLVSVLTSKTSCLRELILTDSHIKDAGVKHLCTGLGNTQCQLEALRLKNCGITHEGCTALASALRSNPSHLRELDLSGNPIRNSGVKLLSDELGNQLCKLEKILLRNCGITHEADAALVSLLSSHLRELNLSKNALGDLGIKLLSGTLGSSNCELQILLLENCCITHEGCAVLASALGSNPLHLRELDLSANKLTNNGVKRLLVNLESSGCNLEILRLDICGVTEEGCAALASALKSSCLNLKMLTLNWNKIGGSGVRPLFAALGDPNCKLQVLRLRDCKITDEGYDALASTLKTNPSHLKELDLSQNKLSNPGIELLSTALAYPNCKLEILRLETCDITDKGCAFLASALRSNPSHLRELDLYMNKLGCLGGKLISDMKDDPTFKLEIVNH